MGATGEKAEAKRDGDRDGEKEKKAETSEEERDGESEREKETKEGGQQEDEGKGLKHYSLRIRMWPKSVRVVLVLW